MTHWKLSNSIVEGSVLEVTSIVRIQSYAVSMAFEKNAEKFG